MTGLTTSRAVRPEDLQNTHQHSGGPPGRPSQPDVATSRNTICAAAGCDQNHSTRGCNKGPGHTRLWPHGDAPPKSTCAHRSQTAPGAARRAPIQPTQQEAHSHPPQAHGAMACCASALLCTAPRVRVEQRGLCRSAFARPQNLSMCKFDNATTGLYCVRSSRCSPAARLIQVGTQFRKISRDAARAV